MTAPTSSSTEAAKETSRLETFADGVFAIAITLLVLEIHVPEGGEDLGAAILAQWPSFAAYVISFLTIGVMWVSHHQMFTIIRRTTPTFLFLNVSSCCRSPSSRTRPPWSPSTSWIPRGGPRPC